MSGSDVPADLAGDREVRRGTVFGGLAYLLWGVFPLYFHALLPAGSIEILVHRVVWSLLVCLVVVAVLRDTSWIRPLLAAPRRLVRLGFAAMFIAVNWGVYIAPSASAPLRSSA